LSEFRGGEVGPVEPPTNYSPAENEIETILRRDPLITESMRWTVVYEEISHNRT